MSSIDSRIVTMKFDNSAFERGASATLSTLGKLKAALSFDGLKSGIGSMGSSIGGMFGKLSGFKSPFSSSQQSLSDLQRQANSFSLQPMEGAVTHVSGAFIAMATVAITAISNITSKVLSSAGNMIKGFSFSPILDGLHEYQTNLQAIQTVQANTDRPLPEINKALQELNTYSDQTIYNFGEMAKNVGTFTAAGVDLKTSVSSIKGIANMAALSGSNSQQAATAMYQLSQAISSGKVGLMDWNSVVNAGMGGKKLQNALAQTAVAMGDINANAVKMEGPMQKLTINGKSFRESIMANPGDQAWLSSDVLVNTLASLDGRFSVVAQKAMLAKDGTRKFTDEQIKANMAQARASLEAKNGVKYTDAQYKALQHLSDQAFNSATQVKTLGQVFDIAKETIGSGWSASFQNIFGNLNEAKALFTDMSNGLNAIIRANALARNNLLAAWKKGGGRNDLIEGLKNAWGGLVDILTPIHEAFRDIFPKTTAKDLIALTANFRKFTESLTISDKTAGLLYRTFSGVFAIFHIAGSIIGGFIGMIAHLIGTLSNGGGGFLSFTAGIGDFLVAIDHALTKGGLLAAFFKGLGAILAIPLKIISKVASAIGSLFSGLDGGAAGNAASGIAKRLDPIGQAVERVKSMFDGFGEFMSNALDKGIQAFAGFAGKLASSFTSESFGKVLDAINTGLLAGIVLMLKNFLSGGMKVDVGGGLFAQIKDTLTGVTGALQSMQAQIKSDVLMKIAVAVGILAAALLVLSTIDPQKLATALVGMAAAFVIVNGAVETLVQSTSIIGTLKLPLIAASLLILSVAVLALAGAVKVFASMDLGTMARGLLGVKLALVILTQSTETLSKNSAGMISAGTGLLILAFALKVMATAIQDFAAMSWGTMIKGMIGISAALLVLAGAMRLMPKGMVAQAAGLVILGGALKIIGSAISQIGSLDMGVLVQGILGLGAALLVIAAALALMPGPMLILQAAGLAILSGALVVIGQAVASMGGLSMEEIAKGLGTLAGALLILAAGLYLMSGSIVGAAALVIAAGALAVLVPVLVALGAMSWDMIIRGLTMLAGTFLVVGLAGLLLGPLVPVIFAFSASLLLLGAGLALAGAGALMFATAFGIVVAAGSAGVVVLGAILGQIISSIPKALAAFGRGIVAFASAIAKGAPAFFRAFSAIISSLLKAVIKAIPQIGKLFMTLMQTVIGVVQRLTPQVIQTGIRMIVQFLAAVAKNVPKIVRSGVDIVVKFINGVANNIGRIIQAGANLVIKFINGVANAIRNNSTAMGQAGGNLATALVQGMARGIAAGIGTIAAAARNLASNAFHSAMDFLKAHSPSRLFMEVGGYVGEGFAIGMDNHARRVSSSAEGLASAAFSRVKNTMSQLSTEIDGKVDMAPVITPVLDLTEVQKGAAGITSVLDKNRVDAAISYRNASSVSAELIAAAKAAVDTDTTVSAPREIKLEQNNYSPEPLNPVQIYRNTKGLMSLAKEALESNGRN